MSKLNRSTAAVAKPDLRKAGRARFLATTAIVGAIAAMSASPVHALSGWLGGTSADWFSAGNWSGGVVPYGDEVWIDNGANAPVIGLAGATALAVTVGNVGTGSLLVNSGGTLTTYGPIDIIGFQPGSNGTMTVDGGSATMQRLDVGYLGTGRLNVVNGGTVSLDTVAVGTINSGVLVIGTGGTVSATGQVTVGASSQTGTLAIGALSGQPAVAPGTLNAFSVALGSGGSTVVFNHTSNSYIFAPAISGLGSVRVESGTTIFTGQNTYGNGTFIRGGTLEVSGPNGAINSGAAVAVGTLAGSTGTFNITGGGTVTSGNGQIGSAAGATGAVTVSGAGSIWTNTAFLTVGDTGNGSLTIENGGTVIGNISAAIGSGVGTTGSVTVTGANSRFYGNSSIGVGALGNGSLLVEAGGVATSLNSVVGGFNSGSGAATVTGAGSAWNTSTNFSLGAFGQGTLTIANGGSVSAGTALTIGVSAGSTGTLNIGAASGQAAAAAGALVTPSVVFGAGTGQIVFNHTDTGYVFASDVSGAGATRTEAGTTIFTGTDTYSGGTTIAGGTLQLGNGGITGSIAGNVTNNAALVFNRSNAYGFSGVISGSGVVQQNGTGITTLTAANTYTGGTVFNGGALSVGADANLGGAAGALTFNGGILQVTGTTFSTTTRTINWGANGGGFDVTDAGNAFTLNQSMGAGGALTKFGAGNLVLTATNTYVGGTTIAAGTLQLGNGGTTGSITGNVTNNGTLALNRSNTYQFDGVISGTGALQQNGAGTTTLTADNAYTGGTTISAGVLQLGIGGASGSIVGNVLDNATLAVNRSDSFSLAGEISGTGTFQQLGTGTTILTNANTYTGGTTISTGTLRVGNGGTSGSIIGQVTNNAILAFDRSNAYQFDGVISGTGALQQLGSGKTTLTAVSTYTGTTTINSGTLSVNGDITSSSGVMVNAGGTLGGNGILGDTTINGGKLAPGNSIGLLTVQGNLTFTAASSYMVEVSPSNADRTNVMGTATLGGATVNASFAPGTFVAKQYTILSAAGGVSGGFAGPVNTNLPANFKSSLSYDANDVFLNLALAFVAPPATGPIGNQQSVGNTITGFFNSNGTIPMVFGGLTSAGLSQISGETATGSQQATFDAMNLFMGVMTDPFIAGRGDGVSSSSGAPQFADENDYASAYADNGKPRTNSERDAYAAIYRKTPPLGVQRWSVWAAGYGGSQTTDGNAALGSNSTTSRIAGTAVGADYRFSPFTLAGFALAGGGTNFSIANGLGSGRSDLFQAGAFVRHTVGPAYLSAALAYGWQDITTDRIVMIAGVDRLRAKFDANAFSGRVEGGYRFVTPWMGITPYAAGQFTTFDLPAYAEQALSGANTFALSYGAKSVTASRSELGVRTDKSWAMTDAIFTLRGRFAWAHDFNTDRNIAATFQTLPGASFVVDGAAQAHNAALTTASAEMKFISGLSLAATFEGEFSDVTRSYAGKGVVRYAW